MGRISASVLQGAAGGLPNSSSWPSLVKVGENSRSNAGIERKMLTLMEGESKRAYFFKEPTP